LCKKAYESDPIAFHIPQEKYAPGKIDIAYYPYFDKSRQINEYVNLKDMIDFLKSDDPGTYYPFPGGDNVKIFPSKKVYLVVDKQACIRNGIVPKYLQDQIVDTIFWTIRSNQLYKNDVMLLDLVASNNWRRPLYFSSPASVNHCFNVDSFCLVTGWVYKFMPVKARKQDFIPNMGGVDAITSYDILMNKCAWGNLNDPHVYVDPESLNNAGRPKTNILRTAEALIDMGRKTEATRLMDVYFEKFPENKFVYDIYNVPFAEMYYKVGEPAKANKIMERLCVIYGQNLDYYYTFKGKYKDYFSKDVEQALGIIKRMNYVAKENNQDKLAARIDSLFNIKIKSYR
jgi:hypothetical protein